MFRKHSRFFEKCRLTKKIPDILEDLSNIAMGVILPPAGNVAL